MSLEMVGGRDGDCDWVEMREMVAVLICSDSFCFFLLVDGVGDAELGDNDCDEDALCKDVSVDDDGGCADDTADTFLLFTFGLAVIDSVCVDFPPFANGWIKAAAS